MTGTVSNPFAWMYIILKWTIVFKEIIMKTANKENQILSAGIVLEGVGDGLLYPPL